MFRRAYTAALAGPLVPTAGCAGRGDTGNDADRGLATRTDAHADGGSDRQSDAVAVAVRRPPSPSIERANLVWRAGVDGFVSRRAMGSAGAGGTVQVGMRAALRVSGGSISPRFDVSVVDDEGDVVAEETLDREYDVSVGAIHAADYRLQVDLSDGAPGTYTGEIRLTDTARGRSMGPTTFDFELREPLGGSEVSVRAYEPVTWLVDSPRSWTFELANETDAGSSVVGDVRVRAAGGGWTDLGSLTWHLPPNRAVEVETGEIAFERPGTLSFEIRPGGLTWQTETTG